MEYKLDERIEKLFELTEAGKVEEFEILRQKLIIEHINAINDPEQRRKVILIQHRIELERLKFKGNNLHFASYIFGLMWSSFLEMDQAYTQLIGHVENVDQPSNKTKLLPALMGRLERLQSVSYLKLIK